MVDSPFGCCHEGEGDGARGKGHHGRDSKKGSKGSGSGRRDVDSQKKHPRTGVIPCSGGIRSARSKKK